MHASQISNNNHIPKNLFIKDTITTGLMNKSLDVLLMEDNEGDIFLMKKVFEDSQIKSTLNVVRNGREGIEYLTNQSPYENASPPDIILLDLNMPEMSGQEVLEIAKQDDKLKSIPIIVLTTSSSEDDIRQCYQLQANSYIKKPVDFNQFSGFIDILLQYWCQVVKFPPKI